MNRKADSTNRTKSSRNTVARDLAAIHFDLETGITHIFRIDAAEETKDARSRSIMLLEVNENTVPAGILPIRFGPTDLIPYPSVIVEVTPEEFDMLKTKKLKLPDGWSIGKEYTRSVRTTGST